MKHWDGRDRDQAIPLQLSRRDRQRFAQFLEAPAPARRREPQIGSLIGLALSIGLLIGLAWLLTPADPVSSKILHWVLR
jgi:hypothetical protein